MAVSNNLRLQVLLSAADRVTGPFKKILAGSRGLATSLRDQREALRRLNAQQRDIGAYREQVNVARQARTALDAQRAAVRTLAQQIRATDTPSKALNAEFEKAVRVARQLKTAHSAQEATLQRVRGRLEATGISTRDLVAHERRLRNEIQTTAAAMQHRQQQLAKLEAAQRRAGKIHSAGMSAAAHGAGALYAGQRALRAEVLPVGHAMDFESAMADVRKVVDFDTPQQFAEMGRDIENLSMRLPMLPEQIAQIVAAAGQASIPRQELVRFADDAARMGVAFDSTAEESGQTMATWRTAFRMGQEQVVELADKINYLGNTGPASVNKISAVVNRIGALGEVAGLQSGPLAALGATVAGMGIESEVSATGIKNMLLTLAAGDSATKRQRVAFQQLGIDARKMADFMQEDAGGAIVSVLKKLQALPKAEQSATLTKLFGRESVGAIAPLLTNLELLETNFAKVADAQVYGGSMAAEYAARVATSANALQLAKNTAVVLSQSIGQTLLPDVKLLSERVASVVTRCVDWIRANPQLTATLAKLVIGGTALVTVFGALLLGGGMAAMAFSQIHKAVLLVGGGGGIGGLIGKIGALAGQTFPMLLNVGRLLLVLLGGISAPVLAIGAAIAVVAALVWKYWEPIKAFMIGVWQGLSAAFAPVLEQLRAALAPLAPVWEVISDAMAQAWAWVKQLLAPFEATNEQLEGATAAGRQFGHVLGVVMGLPLQLAARGIESLVAAFRVIEPVVRAVLGGAFQYIRGAWELIAGLFSGNGERMRQGLLQMWSGVNGILAGWPAKMLQAGTDMVAGLVAGIRAKIGDAGKAIAAVGDGVIGKFKNLLGIHSPSRVFAQLGGFTMQGLAVGLQRGERGPLEAVARLGGRMTGLGAGIALAAATAPVMAFDSGAPVAARAPASPGAMAPAHYEIHIHPGPAADAKAIAAEVARQIEEIERRKAARARSGLRDD